MNITLINGKSFKCGDNQTIFESAKNVGITLEHSCLAVRCRSCAVQIIKGETKDRFKDLVLSEEEKEKKIILSCNAIPLSDLVIDAEDLSDFKIEDKKIVPSKIDELSQINNDVIEVVLRLPPNSSFNYISGQYVNIIKGPFKRSYSIANPPDSSGKLKFFIKKYDGGIMSNYWFNEAKKNDLLRIEGPLGTFFIRESKKKHIIFLATGTGIAPVKAILEGLNKNNNLIQNKTIWVLNGARYANDFIWSPLNLGLDNINFIQVTSREKANGNVENGYVQNILLQQNIDLSNAQVYACGSNEMIISSKEKLIKGGLEERHFFSDAFVKSN